MSEKRFKLRHDPEHLRPEPWTPPIASALASLILPGLGQVLARAYRRGLIFFASMASILGLFIWRLRIAAPRDEGWFNITRKALRLDPNLIIIVVLIALFWLWIIYDAYRITKNRGNTPVAIFWMLAIIFFALGWQIGQINIYTMVTQMDEAAGPLGRIGWPWEKAVSYDVITYRGSARIEVPCSDNPPPMSEIIENEPSLAASPTCGELSTLEGQTGTELHLEGYNFQPGQVAEIRWEDPNGNIFRHREGGEYISVIPDENGEFELDVVMPYRLLPPSARDPFYIWEVFAVQTSQVGSAQFSSEFILVVEKMIETIFIGMMATFFGIILALPVSFLAARNLMSMSSITVGIYYFTRGVLNIIRSIEPLIWAIIAVIVVGLGPFAGILALTIHSIASLGKLYSESIESIDPGPIEAIHATGANWVQTIVFAVIPQIIPPFVSFTIYRWDINIRMSTVIGFVGGGGIGFLLAQYIRLLDYRSAGMAVWFIAITVAILDYVSAEIRARFV
jgi:phosphonate transport system permease protein